MQTKLCPKCGQHLPFDQFHSHKGKKHNLKSWCKTCDNAKMAERRKNDPLWADQRNANNSKYRKNNVEKVKEYKTGYEAKPENRVRARERAYLRKYGLTIEQVSDMLKDQNHACKICDTALPTTTDARVDHDHQTGKVRGILCHPCNVALGLFKDSKENLAKAIRYLG
jgi:hypothetical protein